MRWLLAALLVGALSIDFVNSPATGQTTTGSDGASTGPTYPTAAPQVARPSPAPSTPSTDPAVAQAPQPESAVATDPNSAPGAPLR
ncbi:MAG: hypothetical protein NTV97_22805 [Alphaproteobacteria bacterium]|nr:hypothetical protein [Alphaproteobacteria bacterium]